MKESQVWGDRYEIFWFVGAVLYVLGLGSADLLMESESFLGVFLLGPVVAATMCRPRYTAFVAITAIAAAVVTGLEDETLSRLSQAVRLSLTIAGSLFCVLTSKWRVDRERAYRRMARVADVAQMAILHPIPEKIGGFRFSVRYLSAAEESSVGGDFYEVITTRYGLRIIVGDVRGKGLDAVRLAALMLGMFREAAISHEEIADVGRSVDERLAPYLEEEEFVTAVIMELLPSGKVRVLNLGHYPPLLLRNHEQEDLRSDVSSPPFGLQPTFSVTECKVEQGDRVLLYTDGLIEARSPGGTFLRLDAMTELLGRSPLDVALDAVVDVATSHTGGHLNDDLALVLAEVAELSDFDPRGEA